MNILKKLTKEERVEQEKASLKVLGKNAEKEHYFEYDSLDITICKEVFSPYYFNGWRTFTPKLKELVKRGEEFLEIGVGTGITSLLLAKEGVNVSATDINSRAVENTKLNAERNSLYLKEVILSDVYDGFFSEKKFDAIYWNTPWMETINKNKISCNLDYGLFDNGYVCIERWISESAKYLKPKGRLYIGHANFGNFEKLELILDKYGYDYNIVVEEASTEIRDVDFFMYEANLKEKSNKVFIAMPFTGKKYKDIIKEREEYTKKVNYYKLELLESFIGMEEKEEFEKALYKPNFIVEKDINLINQADIMLVDLSSVSTGATFEIAHAKYKREIPVIGFGCLDEVSRRHPWNNYNCSKIVDTVDEALDIAQKYCL